ncbi:MAG: alcohol dehydrogenase catalytic domain-containing protein [Clostridia bacterium]|nr:alcohol dehydrogenase catalytic domain-containing protein [Clostridia bacterium]
MQGYKLTGKGQLQYFSTPPTKLKENQLKVKIEKTLLSYGDYLAYQQDSKYQIVLGRYAVGNISELADNNTLFERFQRVVVCSTYTCGQCYNCKTGKQLLCTDKKQLGIDVDGTYCDFIDVPMSSVFALPESVSFDDGLFVEQISLALNVLDKLSIQKGEHVVILSDTKLGLILGQLVTYYGAIPILVQQNKDIVAKAKDVGIFYAFDDKDDGAIESNIFAITGGRMCEKAIYVNTSDLLLSKVDRLCAHYASTCMLSCDNKLEYINAEQLVKKELTITGVSSPMGNFPTAINLLATNQIDISFLKGARVPLANLPKKLDSLDISTLETKSIIVEIN